MDFLAEFQKIVDDFNAGAANVEAFFAKLIAFVKKLNEEERGIVENFDRRGTRPLRPPHQARCKAYEAGRDRC